MSENHETFSDPLIEEVRQRRRDLYATCDHDLEKLGQAIQNLQRKHPVKMVDRRRQSTAEKATPSGK